MLNCDLTCVVAFMILSLGEFLPLFGDIWLSLLPGVSRPVSGIGLN
jgi:hypothetical protein